MAEILTDNWHLYPRIQTLNEWPKLKLKQLAVFFSRV